jgi:hypothetical protein
MDTALTVSINRYCAVNYSTFKRANIFYMLKGT